jgi:5'-methylthioadenosine phosphorylase
MSKPSADLAIIGGTGVYDPELIDNAEKVKVHTPYGSPSATITIGDYEGKKIAFLQRHGDDMSSHLTRSHSGQTHGR